MHRLMSNSEFYISNQSWPLERPFVISRGAKTSADVVVFEIELNGARGRGECVPYSRYGETVSLVTSRLEQITSVSDRAELNMNMKAGAARNAVDCALWDLEAKLTGVQVFERCGYSSLKPVITAFTLSLGSAEDMAEQALVAKGFPLLKLKLGGGLEDMARMRAVRGVRPDARLIADANEAWSPNDIKQLINCAEELSFEMIEQPLKADQDHALKDISCKVSICADESAHLSEDLRGLSGRYDAVNIKLDKAGGLTEALKMSSRARALGFKVMIGSMVATSLAVAPAILLAQDAHWVDLDGPLLLKDDRVEGLTIQNGWMLPPTPELWG